MKWFKRRQPQQKETRKPKEVKMKLLSMPVIDADNMIKDIENSYTSFINAYDAVAFKLDDGDKPTKAELKEMKDALSAFQKYLEVFQKETGV